MTKIDIDGNENVASIYPTKQNLLIVQDLWQAYYQILLIIWQNELVKELDIKILIVFLNMKVRKDDFIKYKCMSCNKDYSNKFDENLKRTLRPHLSCSIKISIIFLLLLRKSVYPYDYLHDWESFNETTLPKIEEFYSDVDKE